MSKKVKIRTRYKIIGSDFSAQEPRLTSFMSQDPNMMQAYKEGKDLYCVIAANMFGNKYEDNLEFYPEGTEIELDGKKIICGNGANPVEKEISDENYIILPYFKMIELKSGKDEYIKCLKIGDILYNDLVITNIEKIDNTNIKLCFE